MIAFVKGRLAHKEATHVIIEVNGIGYEVFISLATYSKIKEEESCMLYTHFHVKEDSQALYGFLSEAEKGNFLDLISISGIGPSTAMIMQSSLSTGEIKTAIINEDVKTIQQIKGIGAKTAQRVVLELKDKLRKEGFSAENVQIPGDFDNNLRAEALSALVMLGINRNTAQKSIETVLRNSENNITLEQLIKQALQAS
jgi:Holliday junction DNA helicase RuvA